MIVQDLDIQFFLIFIDIDGQTNLIRKMECLAWVRKLIKPIPDVLGLKRLLIGSEIPFFFPKISAITPYSQFIKSHFAIKLISEIPMMQWKALKQILNSQIIFANNIIVMNFEEHQPKTPSIQEAFKKIYEGSGSVDLHYQICSTFFMNTSESLSKHELRMMAESNKLIDTLQQSKSIQRQNETMEDSQVSESSCKLPQPARTLMRVNSDNIQSKILARKSPIGHAKYLSIAYSDEMRDIEENCSSKTIKSIRALMDEHKKIKDSLAELDLKQKKQERRIQKLQQQQEKLLILRKVEQQNEKKIRKLEAKIQELKNKSQNSSQNLQKIKERPPPFVDPKMLFQLTNYLNEKEKSIDEKMKRVQDIEESILRAVSNEVGEYGCDKCCNFLRKIKEFMLKLRRSLQEETEDIQKIYNKYKNVLCYTCA